MLSGEATPKRFSITSFFTAKPLTIAKKRKPPEILIDDNGGNDPAVSITNNAAITNDSRLVYTIFVVDGEGVLFSFHVVANPKARAEPNLNFFPRWRNAYKSLDYDEGGKGMFCWACRDAKMDNVCQQSQAPQLNQSILYRFN